MCVPVCRLFVPCLTITPCLTMPLAAPPRAPHGGMTRAPHAGVSPPPRHPRGLGVPEGSPWAAGVPWVRPCGAMGMCTMILLSYCSGDRRPLHAEPRHHHGRAWGASPVARAGSSGPQVPLMLTLGPRTLETRMFYHTGILLSYCNHSRRLGVKRRSMALLSNRAAWCSLHVAWLARRRSDCAFV